MKAPAIIGIIILIVSVVTVIVVLILKGHNFSKLNSILPIKEAPNQSEFECISKCGDATCQEITCEQKDCPCKETEITCAKDCLPLPQSKSNGDTNKALTQERVNFLKELYVSKSTINEDIKSFNPKLIEEGFLKLEDGNITLIEGKNYLTGNLGYKNIFLASVSKEYIAHTYLKFVSEGKIEKESFVGPELVKEIILRSEAKRLLEKPDIYKSILSSTFTTNQSLEQGAEDLAFAQRLALETLLLFPVDFKLPAEEIAKVTLKYSCNNSNTLMQNKIRETFKSGEEFYDYMLLQYPGFHVHKSEDIASLFIQYDANTGDLTNLMKLQNNIALNWENDNLIPLEREVLEERINGTKDFLFNLSTTEWMHDLQSLYDFDLIEKTGYFPIVTWVENQGEKYPAFMIMESIETFVPRSESSKLKKTVTVAYYALHEVPFPQTEVKLSTVPEAKAYEPDVYIYDISTEEEEKYIMPIKYDLAEDFRKSAEKKIKDLLSVY